MNRRNFIGKTAVGAAAITVVPRHVLGGNGFIAASDRMNIGYIGAGKQVYTLLDGIGKCKETVAVAVCDVYKKKLEALARAANENNAKKGVSAKVDSYHY